MKKLLVKTLAVTAVTAALLTASATGANAAGNLQGWQFFGGGIWKYGVSSTVVWSNFAHAGWPHSAGVQAGSKIKWVTTWNYTAEVSLPRVAYENYQFARNETICAWNCT
ncbi:lactococcin 972 family bacteriocin [Leucobacter luti]|uniref:lactococcin 972 family bacteriocin n=1 Tax=Leucobacter luti TaxID=340320 RepID=UPI001053D5A0|nr:lactococcin 972 family bacteriocin [Leucobacter luti]MCW2289025.1 hypothetical protein [Leucobacter luti]